MKKSTLYKLLENQFPGGIQSAMPCGERAHVAQGKGSEGKMGHQGKDGEIRRLLQVPCLRQLCRLVDDKHLNWRNFQHSIHICMKCDLCMFWDFWGWTISYCSIHSVYGTKGLHHFDHSVLQPLSSSAYEAEFLLVLLEHAHELFMHDTRHAKWIIRS